MITPKNNITHHPVKSSTIATMGHDPTSNTLAIRFKNGGEYHYHGVDQTYYLMMRAADSKGKFLAKVIKPKFKHTKIS
jgi:hypothetical protein